MFIPGEPQPRVYYKPRLKCKICAAIKLNPSLKGRVEQSSSFKPGGFAIRPVISEMDGVNFPNWYSHLKHHHPLRGPLKQIQPKDDPQVAALGMTIKAETSYKDNYTAVWDEIIDRGLQDVANGQIEVTGSMLMKAATDKASFVAKKQDQKLDIAKMMFAFSAGGKPPESKPNG